MDSEVRELHLRNPSDYKKWRTFLESLNILNFEESEVSRIDLTLGIFSGEDLVATGSLANDTLKYIGVCNKNVVTGSRFNVIVSALVNREFQRGIFHMFVFTKKKYSASFQHVGFSELASTEDAAVLENGKPDIEDYLGEIAESSVSPSEKIAGIVMNANPFTSGHRALVEKAASENDFVYVFVVQTEASLFRFDERLRLVQEGTQDLTNVKVVSGGNYMVSYLTFPAYFLPFSEDTIRYQTTLDARIFRNKIAPRLGINKRYVGTEPFSRTTGVYNQILAEELPPNVELSVVDRVQAEDKPVTATAVRQAIKADKLNVIKALVPTSTYDFINNNKNELIARIQKGMNINGN
ncbi:[citrate (pro-3S)-lyase] ligase [Secundilactobacillus kimchicus]|uniref:[citrate (pro-3S)-lyase] ligase n=1 Tax=Secundilactobacillus kimchicus TaxID=528209 RepID=UPI0024A7F820|nr:[citrate (pro-3S)-lyase] ligase [Secundilactobacillus kimchicus]